MNFTLFILGCQYNYYDAKHIAHLMIKMGYVYIDRDINADVIIVLACSVRQKPLDRIFGKIKNWDKLPRRPKIIITACILPQDRKKLINKVYAIIDNDKLETELPKILNDNTRLSINNKQQTHCLADFILIDSPKNTAHIPIMHGCNNFCSYCAVPYTRGQEVSRPMDEIIVEAKKEIKSGKKHIILLGQNVNSYGHEPKFTQLLNKIDKLHDKFDYNFISANPQDFSDELIEFLVKSKKWNKELHLPLQSGNDEVLRKMNRKYTSAQYLSLILNLKSQISNLKLSTDIIVGFPEETKKQFTDTVNLCKKIGFDKIYVSQYSPRPGTPAAKLKDNVPAIEKKRRWQILNNLINKKLFL